MEYLTLGLILSREEGNEADSFLHIYTRDFGRIAAVAKSLRKITSKLSGHLLPGRLVSVRIVERTNGGWQAVDAVSLGFLPASAGSLKFLRFLREVTPLNEPDPEIWERVATLAEDGEIGREVYGDFLDAMGLGASLAKCANCGGEVAYFLPKDIMFMCKRCFQRSLVSEDEAIDI